MSGHSWDYVFTIDDLSDFSKHAAPFNQLTGGKNVPLVWTAECERSFNHLKGILSSPIVIFPEFNVPFKIYSASGKYSQRFTPSTPRHATALL